jgi:hypothetical protein
MMRSRTWVLRLAVSWLILGGAVVRCQPAGDSQEDRLAAAQRYARVAAPEEMLDSATREIAKSLPEEQREDFIRFMSKSLDVESLKRQMIDIMAKHFTTNELNALASFYGSPEGKSVLKKFGPYMADVMPMLQHVMLEAAQKFQKPQEKK